MLLWPGTPPNPIRCFVFALDFDVGRVDPSSAGLGAGEPFPRGSPVNAPASVDGFVISFADAPGQRFLTLQFLQVNA